MDQASTLNPTLGSVRVAAKKRKQGAACAEASPIASSSVQPMFIVVRRSDGLSMDKVSPFLIAKSIQGLVGEVASTRKLRSGELLVQAANAAQSVQLLKLSALGPYPVSAEAHRQLNRCRGVVSCYDLLCVDPEEIVAELAGQHVVAAQRINARRDGVLQPTSSLILTFQTPKLPEYVIAGYHRLSVRPFIPNPMRCFKCQQYGHTQMACTRNPVCGKCGKAYHESDCSGPAFCLACKGDHPVWSRQCPKFLEEKAIMEIKVRDNLSFAEARKKYKDLQPVVLARSFAAVAKPPVPAVSAPPPQTRSVSTQTCSVSTQTDPVAPAPPAPCLYCNSACASCSGDERSPSPVRAVVARSELPSASSAVPGPAPVMAAPQRTSSPAPSAASRPTRKKSPKPNKHASLCKSPSTDDLMDTGEVDPAVLQHLRQKPSQSRRGGKKVTI